jgi:hypothetical protein
LISLSVLGFPIGLSSNSDFFPWSESFSDLVSVISFLNFDMALDLLLRRTQGNLLLQNELNRIAVTSPETQIRMAANFLRMSDVTSDIHDRSQPFTGAVFDSIVDLYHRELTRHGAASPRLLDTDLRDLTRQDLTLFRDMTAQAFDTRPLLFKQALTFARDVIGQALANSLKSLDLERFDFAQAAAALIKAAPAGAADILKSNFEWREIAP